MAAQEQIAADRQKSPEQTRETPPYVDSGDTSSAIAARLTDLFRGHEGLDLEEVESLGVVFLHRLHEAFDQHIDALHLPDSIRVTLDWKLGASCTYWDQPYRPIHTAGPTALEGLGGTAVNLVSTVRVGSTLRAIVRVCAGAAAYELDKTDLRRGQKRRPRRVSRTAPTGKPAREHAWLDGAKPG